MDVDRLGAEHSAALAQRSIPYGVEHQVVARPASRPGKLRDLLARLFGQLPCDVLVDEPLEDRERHRTVSENEVVELGQTEPGTERVFHPLSKLHKFEHADRVREPLSREADVPAHGLVL